MVEYLVFCRVPLDDDCYNRLFYEKQVFHLLQNRAVFVQSFRGSGVRCNALAESRAKYSINNAILVDTLCRCSVFCCFDGCEHLVGWQFGCILRC